MSAVVVAYKQYMWVNLQARANTISAIDAMFAAAYDILAFLSPSLLLKAKIPALMAFITWYLHGLYWYQTTSLTVPGFFRLQL